MERQGQVTELPVTDFVAAVSVGKVGSQVVLDLNYDEDCTAHVDMNVIKTGDGRFVEIQGTAERSPFGDDELIDLLSTADKRLKELLAAQRKVLGEFELKKPVAPKPASA